MSDNNLTAVDLNKAAYVALTASNNAHFETQISEYIDILATEDEEDINALRGVMTATLTHLAVQRKLEKFRTDSIPADSQEVVDYSLEVAENLKIAGFSVRPTIVISPEEVDYKALLELIVATN